MTAYYEPEVVAAYDYYPFGMLSRIYADYNYMPYKFGFNGKEFDHEAKGYGAQIDYGMRVHDTRLGRFLSVDPLTKEYPHYTPYQYAGNKPINSIDIDGLEEWELSTPNHNLQKQAAITVPKSYVDLKWILRPSNQDILKTDIYGNGVMGKRVDVERLILGERLQYNEIIGQSIRNDPFGAAGYLIADDKGALIGSAMGGVVTSFAGLPGKGYSTRPTNEPSGAYKPNTTSRSTGTQTTRALGGNTVAFQEQINATKNTPNISVKLNGRTIIVDENLSPTIATNLQSLGYNVKTFTKGTLDPDIIAYAKQNNAIVLTNNIKDFIKQGITTFEVSQSLKPKVAIPTLIQKIENVNNATQSNSNIIKAGENVKLIHQ